MTIQRYAVNQYPIQTLLTWINSNEIAIPEIQRPFVWSAAKVRDLIDSLYAGYPIGYLIAWRNPAIKLKDGTSSEGKRILIDGQQRVTALMAAILGKRVIDKNYRQVKITIAFHPQQKKFEVSNPAIAKDKAWIADISAILAPNVQMLEVVSDYCSKNEGTNQNTIFSAIELLRGIVNNHIGLIELNSDLDIETVTEIFIRINSQGAVLSQADFAMSKIAANETYGGDKLRKCIDYFCHLAVAPEFYQPLADHDTEFASTDYFQKMAWLKNENDDLYDPSYTDMLRVAFTSEFQRGRLEDLVALLSGRNFQTREYEEVIAEDSFKRLELGLFTFMNETNFKRFVMILRSAGFVESSMIRSQNAINFAYIVYLVLRADKMDAAAVESHVRRWFVMSVLTGRYSASPESAFDYDIKRIKEFGFARYQEDVEQAELSPAFWETGLPQQMNTSVASSPYFKVFLAAQVKANDRGFLSRDITVHDLVVHRGDVHHLFPRNLLKAHGLTRGRYNQIANYAMMQSEVNIAVKDREPAIYFSELAEQCRDGKIRYGAITDPEELKANLAMHCIPENMAGKTVADYDDFLQERRRLMALKIRDYFEKL
ncbi:MAG: hypothetical protein C0613_08025 [Desulfobulbaceae bacterium]|nr:MAG: hypothetical protein C0613_08025 [Desulfobulbaceae bacterium]